MFRTPLRELCISQEDSCCSRSVCREPRCCASCQLLRFHPISQSYKVPPPHPPTPSKTHVLIFISAAHKLCNHYVTFAQPLTKSLTVGHVHVCILLRHKANLPTCSPDAHILTASPDTGGTVCLGGGASHSSYDAPAGCFFFFFLVVQH